MVKRLKWRASAGQFLFVVLVSLACSSAWTQPLPMHNNPGVRVYLKGNGHFEHGRYEQALRSYRQAATWGHKISQFNIGTYYFNGMVVEQDLPTAWAWFKLAAERDYPHMVETAQETWRELSEAQRSRAKARFEDISARYADEVALPRLERLMDRNQRAATGSRLPGAGSSPVFVMGKYGSGMADQVYSDEAWSVDHWLAQEKAWFDYLARTRVRIRDLDENDTVDERK